MGIRQSKHEETYSNSFSAEDEASLDQAYHYLCLHSTTLSAHKLDRVQFSSVLRRFDGSLDHVLSSYLFNVIDSKHDGVIDSAEFISFTRSLKRGTIEDKIDLCFLLLDQNHDGLADSDVVENLLRYLLQGENGNQPLPALSPLTTVGDESEYKALDALTNSTMTSDDGNDVQSEIDSLQIARFKTLVSVRNKAEGHMQKAERPRTLFNDSAKALLELVVHSEASGGMTVGDLRACCRGNGALIVQKILISIEHLFDNAIAGSGVTITPTAVVNEKQHIDWKDNSVSTSFVSTFLRCQCSSF